MMDKQVLQMWLARTVLGQYVARQEGGFIQAALAQRLPERVLWVGVSLEGVVDWEGVIRQNVDLPADIVSLPEWTAWRNQSFDAVVAVHELDCVVDIGVWLAEMFRIVKPNGCVILTGFNPYSLWRWLGDLDVASGVSLAEVKVVLTSMGWRIEEGRFMNYLLPIQKEAWIERWQCLEAVGNRWFPHGAAVYGLVVRKEVVEVRPADGVADYVVPEEVVWALARNKG